MGSRQRFRFRIMTQRFTRASSVDRSNTDVSNAVERTSPYLLRTATTRSNCAMGQEALGPAEAEERPSSFRRYAARHWCHVWP